MYKLTAQIRENGIMKRYDYFEFSIYKLIEKVLRHFWVEDIVRITIQLER